MNDPHPHLREAVLRFAQETGQPVSNARLLSPRVVKLTTPHGRVAYHHRPTDSIYCSPVPNPGFPDRPI